MCLCVFVQSRKPSLAEVGLACETTCETSVCVCVHASIKALASMIERSQGQFCTLQSFYADSTPTPSPNYIFLNWLQPHPHFLLYSVPARAAYITTIYEWFSRMTAWPNGQGVWLRIRRLRVRIPSRSFFFFLRLSLSLKFSIKPCVVRTGWTH